MRRSTSAVFALALLAGCHSQPEPTDTQTAAEPESFSPLQQITSSKIDLPADEETFGESAQGQLLNRTCLACHSTSMIRTQPPLTRKQWTATVTKMREAYAAPFEASETEAIVDALMATAPANK
ncbi:hypothetical protein [Novosphingobium sp. 9U]|uniref:hypothetical protein n=1 Tax=Novosphingobium sp. 9U TaxID=2653158 RepID=UPI0012F00233|nr:hypothetical protein [Novosphingobium sp. 9U]VWX47147.1 conserved hypothetical protein [Novosphingobium sp. 9U]